MLVARLSALIKSSNGTLVIASDSMRRACARREMLGEAERPAAAKPEPNQSARASLIEIIVIIMHQLSASSAYRGVAYARHCARRAAEAAASARAAARPGAISMPLNLARAICLKLSSHRLVGGADWKLVARRSASRGYAA